MQSRVNVTKTFLPPEEEYRKYLDEVWASGQVTNQGPILKRLEDSLNNYLNVETLQYVQNGTIALQLAIRALDIDDGEIITTPFSYIASTSAILWERCKPVFVDIDPETFCIDAGKIEQAITPRTKAILAVHVFGFPCDVKAIEAIAKRHNIRVIYDAAHAFGVDHLGRSLLSYGDVSTCSFHATKLFHTIEGGAVIPATKEIAHKVELIKRFGHNGDEHFLLGINAKASEFHAAMGLCNLPYVAAIIDDRRRSCELYDKLLFNGVDPMKSAKADRHNYAYYPYLCSDEAALQSLLERLERKNIFPRRYFYPSINTIPYVRSDTVCPISEDIASRIICLPLFYGLEEDIIKEICEVIKNHEK